MTWRILDMFSGIGAFTLGLERAGMQPSAFVEIDPFCRDVLARHWPGVPIHHDVRTADFPAADVICGGFPCQDVSRAGKRAGIAGERSGLYRELVRALRLVRPKYAIVENVAALLDDGMGDVLGDLAEGGDCVEWDCVPANALGACHERDRIWIVAHADGDRWGSGSGRQAEGSWNEPGGDAEAQGIAVVANSDSVRRGPGMGTEKFRRETAWRWECSGAPSSGGASNAQSDGCGQGRQGRPPDSFAWVRDEARRNIADPYGARLAFRFGFGRDAFDKFETSERSRGEDVRQSIWPDEPALSGVDDEAPDWMDRTKATGNTLDPLIPELIGRAILEQSP